MHSAVFIRCFEYQKGWTEDFRAKSDVDFIVQNITLPVHSVLFYESDILQGCFTETTNEGRPQIESCFTKYKVDVVDAFLSQLYPSADPSRRLLDAHFYEVMEMGIHLDCGSVIASTKKYTEGVLELEEGLYFANFSECEAVEVMEWFTLVEKIESEPLSRSLMSNFCCSFNDLLKKFSDDELTSILSKLSGEMRLELFLSIDNQIKEKKKVTLYQKNACTSCQEEGMKMIQTWKVNFKDSYRSLDCHCAKCEEKFKISF